MAFLNGIHIRLERATPAADTAATPATAGHEPGTPEAAHARRVHPRIGHALLDGTVVNVALPAIEKDLGGGLSGQQWVVNGYALALGSLILDRRLAGRRLRRAARCSLLGVGGFGVTSVLCALAPIDRGAGRRPGAPGLRRRAAHAERAGRDHLDLPARTSAARRSGRGRRGAASPR